MWIVEYVNRLPVPGRLDWIYTACGKRAGATRKHSTRLYWAVSGKSTVFAEYECCIIELLRIGNEDCQFDPAHAPVPARPAAPCRRPVIMKKESTAWKNNCFARMIYISWVKINFGRQGFVEFPVAAGIRTA